MINLPNILSFCRLLAVPIAVWLMLDQHFTAAFWLFVAAGLTDAIDGFLAKRFGWETELGSYLDPLADKALLVSVFVVLGWTGHIPLWLTIMVVFRDLLMPVFAKRMARPEAMAWLHGYHVEFDQPVHRELAATV